VPVSTVLSYILGVVVVAVGVLLSILLHEAGHFVFAKLFKVRVGQFMVGFGKTLWSRKIGETEFGVKALPLGGYISMSGMYPPIKPGGKARDASTGFFQTLVQDAGPGIVETIDPAPEDQADRSGFLKTLVSDARDASASTILPGHEDRVFYKLAIWKRIIIMLGGPVMNLVIATVLFIIIICGLGATTLSATVSSVPACVLPATSTSKTCAASDPISPAAKAGFKPGDKIESIDGTAIHSWAQVTSIIQKSTGKQLAVVVARAGHDVTLTAVPVANTVPKLDSKGNDVQNSAGTVETRTVGFLGIDATITLKPLSPSYVLPAVWDTTTRVG
jgi:membrane-associated protease RseP (regulator of RpoE activity)